MRKPLSAWVSTFASLGLTFPRIRRYGNVQQRGRETRTLRIEHLPTRQLLAADIDIVGFDADDSDVVVHYDISGASVPAFDIAVFTTTDGSTPDTLLALHRVSAAADRAVGTNHTATIGLDFTDSQSDYRMMAIVDDADEVIETNEGNNSMSFEGGIFQSLDGTVHVHGTDSNDNVSVSASTNISVTLNGHTAYFAPSSVTQVHVRAHEANDTVSASAAFTKHLLAIGGAGNDSLSGGYGNDILQGGAGNDSLSGGYGNDVLEGGVGDDASYGGIGDDTFVFSNSSGQDLGSDTISETSYGGTDTLDLSGSHAAINVDLSDANSQTVHNKLQLNLTSGVTFENVIGSDFDDTITGGSGGNLLRGGIGNDTIYGNGGNDTIYGEAGNDLIYGDAGDDSVYGGAGDDMAFGGLGSDYLDGGTGANTLDAGGDAGDRTRPEIRPFTAEKLANGKWKLSGCIVDDSDSATRSVQFTGVVTDSTTVDSYGCFELIVDAPPSSGAVFAEFEDEHGLISILVSDIIIV